ncbi:carboxypeptidase-like regulatory domain-containing protein [Telmatobacter sp. DSM 110680]|uniref:Carboxypeptidase-like regulatory domain-containing protein n=1 Tax=Telmatobacter sp. DSM 110680 TaxID=3036704 RepID=A0AAU7DKL9_9BACT
MKKILRMTAALTLSAAASAHAAAVNGTVTNKTTNKPAAGDKVTLVDPSAGMADAASTVTDTAGQFRLQTPGNASYLIRVEHQGGTYFIAAPQGGSPADITVYDVGEKVDGVGIDADMLLIEAGRGTLRVRERYLVRNLSSPPRTQFSDKTFEIVLPDGAQLDEAAATRPGGLGTRTHLIPLAQTGHYTFNVPIQPDQGEKETLFEVQYHFVYNGRHALAARPQMMADNVVVYTAKGIEFAPQGGSRFQATQEDPKVETHVVRNVHPGEEISFTVSGEGEMPVDATGSAMQPASSPGGGRPGGGIGTPIASPDPLTGSKSWLLGGFAVLLAGIAFFVLRRRADGEISTNRTPVAEVFPLSDVMENPRATVQLPPTIQVERQGSLLETLKEELFALEQDKIAGLLSAEEYAQAKAGLQAVLKRVLNVK